MKTKQEVFDKIVNHLRSMETRSANGAGTCRYRAPDGNKCAVGILISDNKYSESMEGLAVCTLVDVFSHVLPKYISKYSGMLEKFQELHDEKTNWRLHKRGIKKSVESVFKKIAEAEHLVYTPLNT